MNNRGPRESSPKTKITKDMSAHKLNLIFQPNSSECGGNKYRNMHWNSVVIPKAVLFRVHEAETV